MCEMMNHPWFSTIYADEAESSEDRVIREIRVKEFLIPESVLKCQETSAFFQERGNQFGECFIRSRLQGNDDQIDRTDFLRVPEGQSGIQSEVSALTFD